MREDHVSSAVSLLKQVSFTLRKLAEDSQVPTEERAPASSQKEYTLDTVALRKLANESNS